MGFDQLDPNLMQTCCSPCLGLPFCQCTLHLMVGCRIPPLPLRDGTPGPHDCSQELSYSLQKLFPLL